MPHEKAARSWSPSASTRKAGWEGITVFHHLLIAPRGVFEPPVGRGRIEQRSNEGFAVALTQIDQFPLANHSPGRFGGTGDDKIRQTSPFEVCSFLAQGFRLRIDPCLDPLHLAPCGCCHNNFLPVQKSSLHIVRQLAVHHKKIIGLVYKGLRK